MLDNFSKTRHIRNTHIYIQTKLIDLYNKFRKRFHCFNLIIAFSESNNSFLHDTSLGNIKESRRPDDVNLMIKLINRVTQVDVMTENRIYIAVFYLGDQGILEKFLPIQKEILGIICCLL